MQQASPEERRALYRGYNNSLASAFELALTPPAMAALGWLLDRWLGTMPVFMIVLLVIGLVGVFTKLWFQYAAEMAVHEQSGPWASAAGRGIDVRQS